MQNFIHIEKRRYMTIWVGMVALLAALVFVVSTSGKGGSGYVAYVLAGGMALLIFGFMSSRYYFKTLTKPAKAVANYYLIHMTLRFVLGGIILLLPRLLMQEDNRRMAMVTFAIFFAIVLVEESIFYVCIEKRLNERFIEK